MKRDRFQRGMGYQPMRSKRSALLLRSTGVSQRLARVLARRHGRDARATAERCASGARAG